jgi:hypothetical protein
MNIARYPEMAAQFNIDDSGTSWQLPSLIMFKAREEWKRLPFFNKEGKVVRCFLEKVPRPD